MSEWKERRGSHPGLVFIMQPLPRNVNRRRNLRTVAEPRRHIVQRSGRSDDGTPTSIALCRSPRCDTNRSVFNHFCFLL